MSGKQLLAVYGLIVWSLWGVYLWRPFMEMLRKEDESA